MAFNVFTDSSCDLTPHDMKRFGIDFVPFYVSFDKKNFLREHYEVTSRELYDFLRKFGPAAKTSLPSVSDYANAFRDKLKQGLDVFCLCLMPQLSGSLQSATTAANDLREEFPERKLVVMDSYHATGAQGLIAIQAARMRNDGHSFDTTVSIIERLKSTARLYFTLDSLDYLQKGGRLGLASALLGSILNVKPVFKVIDGVFSPQSKVRGRQKALNEIVKLSETDIGDEVNEYDFTIVHTDVQQEGEQFLERIKSILKIDPIIPITKVGSTVACHTGPGGVGIAFAKKYEALMKIILPGQNASSTDNPKIEV